MIDRRRLASIAMSLSPGASRPGAQESRNNVRKQDGRLSGPPASRIGVAMRALPLLVVTLVLASCVAPVAPPRPAPAPAPIPTYTPPPPAPRPTPVPLGADWRDWPVTPGEWLYRQDGRGSIALFGQRGTDAT